MNCWNSAHQEKPWELKKIRFLLSILDFLLKRGVQKKGGEGVEMRVRNSFTCKENAIILKRGFVLKNIVFPFP